MTSTELKQAHKQAKKAQLELGGDYIVYLAFYMKKENRIIEFQCTGRKLSYGASKAQFSFLQSFSNVEVYIAFNRFNNYCTTQKASELIELAKQGNNIEIFA